MTPRGASSWSNSVRIAASSPVRSYSRLADVEEWLLQASRTFNRAPVIVDPWQAVGLAQRLRDRGVQVKEFTFSPASVGRLGSTLHLLIRERTLDLPDDEELLDELRNVRLKESGPGILRLDHDPDRHDDRAVALALAAYRLLDRAVQKRFVAPIGNWRPSPWVSPGETNWRDASPSRW